MSTCKSEVDQQFRQKGILNFMDWCERNHLVLNLNKTKELLVGIYQITQTTIAMNIQG